MKKIIIIFLLFISFGFTKTSFAQCFPTQPKTAAYATGGTSVNKNEVLWLTWGSTMANVSTFPYGNKDQVLTNGASSYASIDVGGGRYLCVQAVISKIDGGGGLKSYAPGNYGGDSMDDMYNIGGVGSNNKLVSGLINANNAGFTSFTVTCKATLQNVPVKLYGMVIGDAESLSAVENFSCTANGSWNIVELKKNSSNTNPYEIRKTNLDGGLQLMQFLRGNNQNTGAVSFCTFNEGAYIGDEYEVSFEVTLKGGGLTAIALGVLPPGVDGGDAPQTYGNPLHMIDRVSMSTDGIAAGGADGPITNLNSPSYVPGKLIPPRAGFLGTVAPDIDVTPLYSNDALGDNKSGNAGLNEENAWPALNQNLTYKTYRNLKTITAIIPYKGEVDAYITGWIDFNANGVFEDGERATASAPVSGTSATLSWTIPSDTKFKSTYIRLRYAKNQSDIMSPISAAPGGEVEDHRFKILTPAITNPMLPNKAKTL